MQFSDTSLLRTPTLIFSILIAVLFSSNSFALSTHTLTRGEWSLVSIPADPGSGDTVELLFGDDLPAANYGPTGGWLMFVFDAAANTYRELTLNDSLEANTGYWIVQLLSDTVELDVPDSLAPLTGEDLTGCPTNQNCVAKTLFGNGTSGQWNLSGASVDTALSFSDTRFQLNGGACATGCDPTQAIAAGLIGSTPYLYTGEDYEAVSTATTLQPWDGIWIPVLANSPTLTWVVPVGDATDPNSPLTAAEKDATRLLMQGSFGPTDAAISNVLELGGPAEWIEAQLALPVQRHLPIVKQLFPDEADDQQARYEAFWRRALRANDQLRQRVAFALSQILVISDRNDSIKEHGNLTAAYYDLLLNNAFGNYRQLLQEVTLSPAMGLFLSMLGNDKPDSARGLRADENYARELMQLFSIGLVGLNLNGTEREGVVTYTQPDVENLARVFTGWFWNVDNWRTNTRYAWRPNRVTLEQPMVVFNDHHDTDSKTVLGTTFPAGQTAEADLNMALDLLFNHPNVGPFVSKQLIKRLVTSNPSNAYIRRVASIFNNNGSGVRGDMSAVVSAILLDDDARNPTTSNRTDFGKLREPLLRYAHLWRAFRVTEPIQFRRYLTSQIPQIAPLTAPSVFNFYSPNYAPPGTLSAANLVAPEFQINSGSSLNTVNSTMMRVIQTDEFRDIPTTLNLQREIQLLDDPTALLNHLDRLLTAGRLTAASRQVLVEYINSNYGEIDDERLLRDVIGLVVTSTEFAIQR